MIYNGYKSPIAKYLDTQLQQAKGRVQPGTIKDGAGPLGDPAAEFLARQALEHAEKKLAENPGSLYWNQKVAEHQRELKTIQTGVEVTDSFDSEDMAIDIAERTLNRHYPNLTDGNGDTIPQDMLDLMVNLAVEKAGNGLAFSPHLAFENIADMAERVENTVPGTPDDGYVPIVDDPADDYSALDRLADQMQRDREREAASDNQGSNNGPNVGGYPTYEPEPEHTYDEVPDIPDPTPPAGDNGGDDNDPYGGGGRDPIYDQPKPGHTYDEVPAIPTPPDDTSGGSSVHNQNSDDNRGEGIGSPSYNNPGSDPGGPSDGYDDYDNTPSPRTWVDEAPNFDSEPTHGYDDGWINHTNNNNGNPGNPAKPVLLDLDGDGLEVTELSRSTVYMDATGDGLLNRTAWAGAGDGVLFYDPDGHGEILEKRQYVFTEWDSTATSDLEALASIFDSNDDGVLDSSDDDFDLFKVMVTNSDGSLEAKTLVELGITSINLTADATHTELPDGSVIAGESTFTWADGSTGTVGDMVLQAEAQGYRVEQVETFNADGDRTVVSTAYDDEGAIVYQITSTTLADGSEITNLYDDNGDGIVDRIQQVETIVSSDGTRTESETNWVGAELETAILANRKVVTTSADGLVITIERDSTGGDWFNQREVRTTNTDGSRTIVMFDLAQDGSVIRSLTETVSVDGLTRSESIDEDGDRAADTTVTHVITINDDGSRNETITTTNGDGSVRNLVSEDVSADGRTKVIERDLDGDGNVDTREVSSIIVADDGSSVSGLTVQNGDGSIRSTVETEQSADTLSRTTRADFDGDGVVDFTETEETVVDDSGRRQHTVTRTSADGTLLSMTKEVLEADKVSSQTWVDLDHNGVFDAHDLVSQVVVDDTTGERTTTRWSRNPDGSINSKIVSVTSEDGLSRASEFDADGDGDTDTRIVETITEVGLPAADGTASTADPITIVFDASYDAEERDDSYSVEIRYNFENAAGDRFARNELFATNTENGLQEFTEPTTGNTYFLEVTMIDVGNAVLTVTDEDGNILIDNIAVLGGSQEVTSTPLEEPTTPLEEPTESEEAHSAADSITINFSARYDEEERDNSYSVEIRYDFEIAAGDRFARNELFATNTENGLQEFTDPTTDKTYFLEVSMIDVGNAVLTVTDEDGNILIDNIAVLGGSQEVTSTPLEEPTIPLEEPTESEEAHSVESEEAHSVEHKVETFNQDGSLRSAVTTETSADGMTVTTRTDIDGDGVIDYVSVDETVAHEPDPRTGLGSGTLNTRSTYAADGTLLSQTKTWMSADRLTLIEEVDSNGDGFIDFVRLSVTDDSGAVEITETNYNPDGTVVSQTVIKRSANGLETITSIDRDGDLQADDIITKTTQLNDDGSRILTVDVDNADGSDRSQTITTMSDNGLSVTEEFDEDGDNISDRIVSSVTVINADGSRTKTVEHRSANGSLLKKYQTVTSADEMSVTTRTDIDGDGVIDYVSVDETVAHEPDPRTGLGSGTLNTRSTYAADGTLLSQTKTWTSADRLKIIEDVDSNGDGFIDFVRLSVTDDSGAVEITETTYNPDGTVVSQTVIKRSANGLETITSIDRDGDLQADDIITKTTQLNDDGSRILTVDVDNADGSDRSQTITTMSDNGLSVTEEIDEDGDNISDRIVSSVTVINADGSRTKTVEHRSANGSLLKKYQTVTSNDGLISTVSTDNDGDGTFDMIEVTTRALSFDGGTRTTVEVKDGSGNLRSTKSVEVSGNGQAIKTEFDNDGDGIVDQRETVTVHNDGTRETDTNVLNADGTAQWRRTTTTSDDGLEIVRSTDFNGDGGYDRVEYDTTTLNADGSTTRSVVGKASDGTVYFRSETTISADGLTSVTSNDWDGDGQYDLITTRTVEIATDGGETVSVERRSANGTLLDTWEETTSSDRRSVLTEQDIDGDGTVDVSTTESESDSGDQSTSTSFYSNDGTLLSTRTSFQSSDGLESWWAIDRDADGVDDLISERLVTLNDDGSTRQVVTHKDGSNNLLASSKQTKSDDGLTVETNLDFDGDGLFDFNTVDSTSLDENGSTVRTVTTKDAVGATLSSSHTTTGGNEMSTAYGQDMNGDGIDEKTISRIEDPDGGLTTITQLFADTGALTLSTTVTMNYDQRSGATAIDLDGDGQVDRTISWVLNDDDKKTSVYRDLGEIGLASSIVSVEESANGADITYSFDIDGDLIPDFKRQTTVTYDDAGNKITDFTEIYGSGVLNYQKQTIQSANGLLRTTEIDENGDGTTDATTNFAKTHNDDGSTTAISETFYANGDLRSRWVETVSADQLTITLNEDFTGNGLDNRRTVTIHNADGSSVERITSYLSDPEFKEFGEIVTTTSADGLLTTIERYTPDSPDPESVQTITRSSINSGSYVWESDDPDTGQETVTHEIDASGIEHWKYGDLSEARFDAASKKKFLEEAASIYDTVLDRNMSFAEMEVLVKFVTSGSQLDQVALAQSLFDSDEYQYRYGSPSDAQFVVQSFLNAHGRAPSLDELGDQLDAFSQNQQSRAEFAATLARSVEHLMVENSHRSTNNFDLELNPAQFERSLDKAYVEKLIDDLFDVIFDRSPTTGELATYSARLLTGSDELADIAQGLISVQNLAVNPFFGTTTAETVALAFANALNRLPTALEQQLWETRLLNSVLSPAEFIAMLSQSVEHKSLEEATYTGPVIAPPMVSGTSSYDNLYGDTTGDMVGSTHGSDQRLSGLGGHDDLYGDAGGALYGQAVGGDDWLDGGADNDRMYGDAAGALYDQAVGGDDWLLGGSGSNRMYGDAGGALYGQAVGGDDWLDGGADYDRMYGDAAGALYGQAVGGDDRLDGGAGGDYMYGDAGEHMEGYSQGGDDFLHGGSGDDYLFGDSRGDMEGYSQGGDDFLHGGSGDDRLYGETRTDMSDNSKGGNDRLNGGSGDDELYGDAGDLDDLAVGGNDTFVFDFAAGSFGHDTIHDFGEGDDTIEFVNIPGLSSYADVVALMQDLHGATITLDENNSITLRDVDLEDLTADDFRFV